MAVATGSAVVSAGGSRSPGAAAAMSYQNDDQYPCTRVFLREPDMCEKEEVGQESGLLVGRAGVKV